MSLKGCRSCVDQIRQFSPKFIQTIGSEAIEKWDDKDLLSPPCIEIWRGIRPPCPTACSTPDDCLKLKVLSHREGGTTVSNGKLIVDRPNAISMKYDQATSVYCTKRLVFHILHNKVSCLLPIPHNVWCACSSLHFITSLYWTSQLCLYFHFCPSGE